MSAAGPLWQGHLTTYDSAVNITFDISGTTMSSASITAVVTADARRYDLTVDEAVRRGELLATAVTMRLAH